MVQVDVSAVRWQQDSDGAWLCLRVQSPQVAMNACDEYQADKEHVAQIRRKGRSLDANAYCWVLLDKLAAHYNLPREAIYREEIRTIGGVSDVLCMVERAADDFVRRWTAQGVGWMAEQGRSKIPGCVNVTVWYGSSSYDTEQMSRLIDQIVSDCESAGIEHLPPQKLAAMKREWGRDDGQ